MEQSPANQLPEADSLPDGFVESSTEPSIPISETEKQKQQHSSDDYKNTLLDLGRSHEPVPDSIPSPNRERVHETGCDDEIRSSDDAKADKAEKPRTFPVLLSEKGSFDADLGFVRMADEEKSKAVSIAIEAGDNHSNGHGHVEERLENSEHCNSLRSLSILPFDYRSLVEALFRYLGVGLFYLFSPLSPF